MIIEDLRKISDPYKQAEQACAAIEQATGFIDEAMVVRNDAFWKLHHEKHESLRAIASRYGVSKSLVAGIVG